MQPEKGISTAMPGSILLGYRGAPHDLRCGKLTVQARPAAAHGPRIAAAHCLSRGARAHAQRRLVPMHTLLPIQCAPHACRL